MYIYMYIYAKDFNIDIYIYIYIYIYMIYILKIMLQKYLHVLIVYSDGEHELYTLYHSLSLSLSVSDVTPSVAIYNLY